ncbi:MAG: bifunctional UDP-N-acetylmuramoyl-tripeptide:D-alanyl-D-alanine ligase/alanine racemase, partial [Schleiferiaceae bacterium]|nr:bifunctional UDP-N-acetylmuramoyl-tripeptide:D-alanyl-D-alanine ligase/alanine racemase [Schleiferiaceae bacterium]
MSLTPEAIAAWCNGQLDGGISDFPISDLLTDSRTYKGFSGTCFFALRTATNDGHFYIKDLVSKGLTMAVVHRDFENPFPEKLCAIKVDNPLQALQKIAQHQRETFEGNVVGITGSNGKTTVKEWAFQLLQTHFRIARNPGSFNSQTGVPLAVWGLAPHFDLGIFEAGISKPNEMVNLARIIQPQLGIFTNIGSAHQGNFIDIQQKIAEKATLFHDVSKLLYCKDHPLLAETLPQLVPNATQLTWGKTPDNQLVIGTIEQEHQITHVHSHFQGTPLALTIPFSDAAGIENALHTAFLGLVLGLSPDAVAEGIAKLEPIAMRLEIQPGYRDNIIINDSYNSDPESIRLALQFLEQHRNERKALLILSDLGHMGQAAEEEYRRIAALLQAHQPLQLIGVGTDLRKYAAFFPEDSAYFTDTAAAKDYLFQSTFRDHIILIKGARAYQFDLLSEALSLKAHRTQLEVNLTAIAENLRHFKSLLQPQTAIMAMVKAFGYGGGGDEIAATLAYHQVDYLGVAYPDEGVALRQSGIRTPIMVLNSDEENFAVCLQYNLEPEIYSLRSLHAFLHVWSRETTQASVTNIHLKLETGMHRLGIAATDLDAVLEVLIQKPLVRVKSVFSHLAAAGDVNLMAFTQQQIDTFKGLCKIVAAKLGYMPMRHILNSGGILQFPEAQFEMVRLGIGLYGISSHPGHRIHLKPVSRLVSRITQIKTLQPGESSGYGRAFIAKNKTTIATIPIGY